MTLWAEEVDTVHNVYRQPTHSKEENHQGQRFCQLQLLPIIPLPITGGLSASVKLPPDHPEDLCIQSDHYGQRHHHPAEEIEVHHIVHPYDRGEFADNLTGAAEVCLSITVIPANHWNQSSEEREDPAETNCYIRPPLGHYDGVPEDGCWTKNDDKSFQSITEMNRAEVL